MAILLRASGAVDEVHPHGRAFTLAELQAFVGGYIEVVRTRDGQWLVINEDGKRLELPPNPNATELYREAGGIPWDVVVGDVLLVDAVEIGEHDEAEEEAADEA